MARLILTGDVNLMNVTDAATPFRRVATEFRAADVVFSNLECCLYAPPKAQSFHNEGFYADPTVGAAALREATIATVGIANNVNYGDAAAILQLDRRVWIWAGIRSHWCRCGSNGGFALRRSLSVAAFAMGSCNAVPSTGRPTTRLALMIPALP